MTSQERAEFSDQWALSIPLFDNERSDVVPGLLVVFGVGPVAVRELEGENTVLEVNRSRSYQVYALCT